MRHYIAIDPQHCTGCKTCEMACSLFHWNEINSWKSAIRVIRKESAGLVFALPLVCQQCALAPCLAACSTGALSRNSPNDDILFHKEACIDCGLCVTACPIGCVPTDPAGNVIMQCDFCGGSPRCVQICHWHCLTEIVEPGEKSNATVEQLITIIKKEEFAGYLPPQRIS